MHEPGDPKHLCSKGFKRFTLSVRVFSLPNDQHELSLNGCLTIAGPLKSFHSRFRCTRSVHDQFDRTRLNIVLRHCLSSVPRGISNIQQGTSKVEGKRKLANSLLPVGYIAGGVTRLVTLEEKKWEFCSEGGASRMRQLPGEAGM